MQKNLLEKKVIYFIKNRGIKEVELILAQFANQNLYKLNLRELKDFLNILNQTDNELYDWLNKKSTPPASLSSSTMKKLLSFRYFDSGIS